MTEIELRMLARERAEVLSREQAAQAEVETVRRTLLSAVSHELLTPLTIIKGHAEVIRDLSTQADPSLVKVAVLAIDEQVERSRWLVGNLLDAVRATTGVLTVEPAPLLLTPLIERTLRHFEGRSRRHHLVADLPREVPPVLGDRERLESVLYNLLDNAIKYMPRGGQIVVRVAIHATEVEVIIEDQGIGIPKADQPRVFDAYYRAVPGEASHIEGRGLGLYLCKAVVETQGGRIWLASTRGRGTVVHFTVPRVESELLPDNVMDLRVCSNADPPR